MATSRPFLDPSDPHMTLTVENRTRNVFVTQAEDNRPKEKNVNYIPVVTETPIRLLKAGLNTLQKTLVLQKQAELEEVSERLARKQQEFKSGVEALSRRRSELQLKQQQNKERVSKFEKFAAENEVKQHQALKKYRDAREQNDIKQRDIERLTARLKSLQVRQLLLKDRMTKYKIYEDFLVKTISYLPNNYLENDSESLVLPIIRRHETLSTAHWELLQRLEKMEEEVEEKQQQLRTMNQEHGIKKLMSNKELCELQNELESLRETNRQAEFSLMVEQGQSREKVEEFGSILMAISNLAEQCYLPAYGPLEDISVLTMMDMVKEYILDKADTERRARRLMEPDSAVKPLADKKGTGSVKNISSKTPPKISSKGSQKMAHCI